MNNDRQPHPPAATRPRLLDQVRDVVRRKHYSYRTEDAYAFWVKHIDFDYSQVIVRDGKGAKDRVTILPEGLVDSLKQHLVRVKILHEKDLANGRGDVELPHALMRKYPRAAYEWGWKFVFPSHK